MFKKHMRFCMKDQIERASALPYHVHSQILSRNIVTQYFKKPKHFSVKEKVDCKRSSS